MLTRASDRGPTPQLRKRPAAPPAAADVRDNAIGDAGRPNLSRRITIELFQNKEIPKGLAENVARAVSTKAPTAGGGSAASSAYTTE